MDQDNNSAYPHEMPNHGSSPGLTKREYFAAMAMQGILADGSGLKNMVAIEVQIDVPKMAIDMADQLIIELAK